MIPFRVSIELDDLVQDIERANHVENRSRVMKDIRRLKKHLARYDPQCPAEERLPNKKVVAGIYMAVLYDRNIVLPLNHSQGSFVYHSVLLNKLVRLTEESIVDPSFSQDTPDYLQEFSLTIAQRNSMGR